MKLPMRKKGFTLMELMLAVSIFSIFTIFMIKFFFDEYESYVRLQNQLDLQYSANTAVDYIVQCIRNNPDITFLDEDYQVFISRTAGRKLMDISGSGGAYDAELYYDAQDKALKSKQGHVICENIEEIILEPDSSDDSVINVKVSLSAGEGDKRARYDVFTSVNILK